MRILQVIPSMDPRSGGPCQGIWNFAPTILERGHRLEVVCLDDPSADHLGKDRPFTIHALGKSRGPWGYHSALRPWLGQNLARFDTAIVNGLWQYVGFAVSRVCRSLPRGSYVAIPHGMLDPWFQREPSRRLKAVRNWFYWTIAEHRVIRDADAVLFTCREEMRLARTTFRPYAPKIELNVGYGIAHPPAFHGRMAVAFARACPALRGQPFLLFLGRIDRKKGVDILIRAFAKLHSAQAKLGARPCPRLVIAGPGLDTAYGKTVRELAMRLCPPDSVLWPGMLTGDAKWGSLHRAEAFALMSHQENFGIAVVEALACGTPVLISNQINIYGEIARDKAGCVGDDTVLGAERILTEFQNLSFPQRLEMRRAAKACYAARYQVEPAADRLLAAVAQSVKKQPAVRREPKFAALPTAPLHLSDPHVASLPLHDH